MASSGWRSWGASPLIESCRDEIVASPAYMLPARILMLASQFVTEETGSAIVSSTNRDRGVTFGDHFIANRDERLAILDGLITNGDRQHQPPMILPSRIPMKASEALMLSSGALMASSDGRSRATTADRNTAPPPARSPSPPARTSGRSTARP